tara:strand:+ start:1211 stop:2437 length:1227 start_codon:yes stop_codon:yes gene_type:complete
MKNKTRELEEVINTSNRWILCSNKITFFLNETKGNTQIELKGDKGNFVSWLFITVGFFRIVFLYLKQFSFPLPAKTTIPKHIVLETQAPHHHLNYFNLFKTNQNKEHLLIKVFNRNQFTKIIRLSLKEILHPFVECSRELNILLSSKISKELRKLIIDETASNIATYSYYCGLLTKLKSLNPAVKVFHGGAFLFSMAANKTGVETSWLAHGLLSEVNKINVPKFDLIYLYAEVEADYFKQFFNESSIKLYETKLVQNKQKKVICFLNPDEEMKDLELNHLREVVNLFKSKEYEIIFKGHPAAAKLANDLSLTLGAKLATKDISTYDLLAEERPNFTVSFLSTSVCESLRVGIIPICISEVSKSNLSPLSGPFPFEKRSLFWNKESEVIRGLLNNVENYPKVLQDLNTR